MNSIAILPSAYLAPIQYYSKLITYNAIIIEHQEHFIKQTYRSRCNIYSPNGLQTLSIPLVKGNHRQTVKEMKISYDYNWQQLHWKSLESAYRRSPFFEYFEDDFRPFYMAKKLEFLIDFNEELQQIILTLLKIKVDYKYTETYQANFIGTDDYRTILSPKVSLTKDEHFIVKPYSQVFENKFGFIENLSIVDLLFNQGSRAKEYLVISH
jgi:hypothetical protein